MNTKISRIDTRGRVYVPKALRTAAGFEQADFVKLGFKGGSVTMRKVLLAMLMLSCSAESLDERRQ